MKIAFNPSTVAALTTPPNNKDITFDLRGRNIFARGVKFYGTDTNTWRDIKINNVSIGSHTLDLRNGSNTTLTNTNGVVTINSTWRPVVDNLTSDSTTSSLSAKQGKVLKALIDGKSNSDHNHDGRYLKLTGGTMASNALITFADSGSWDTSKKPQGARGGLYWTGQSDYAKLYAEETVGDNLDLVIQFGDDNSNGLSIRNKANTQTSYISAGGVITTGTFKGNLDWSYITNKPASYTPSAHTHAWNSLTHSSTTENQAILTNGKANGWKLYTLNISRWDNAANNAHSHANKSVLDGITSALVNSWNTAYNFVSNITGTDTDKVINKWEEIVNFLAGITEDNKLNTLLNSKLSVYELANNTNVGTIKNNGIYYSTTDASSGTLINSPFNTGFAFINMTSYDGGDDLRRSRLAFNAFGEIKVSDDRDQANTAETWYNVLTSKNSGINGSTIKLNGTSITVYSSGTADGRYVKKSGDTMSGVLTIDTPNFGALTIKRNDDANGASIQFRGKSSVYGYIGLNNSTKDKQFQRWSSDASRIYTILDTSSTYISNGKGVINGTTITQVDNATNSTNSTNARKLVNWYSARPTSLNAQFGDGSLRIFYATSSTTEGKPAEDSHILHLAWDNTGGFDAQLAVHACSGKVSTRAQNGGTWQPWKTLAFITDIPTSLKNPYSFNVFGVVYDGSAAKTVTTSTFVSQLLEGTSTVTDGTMLITSYATNSGFADTNAVNVPYKRKAIHLWEYIKAKTDSLYATKGHTHDGRYLRLSGQDTMQGNLYLHSYGTSYIGKGLGDKSGADFTEANIVIRSWWGISFKSYDDIVRTYIDTRTGNIGTKGVLNAVGAVIQGRVYNGGDDEGIIINPAPNGYAGLILGTHNGERSVFYLKKGNPFWRYNNGSTNLDIYHPKKSGTIALTSDIPNKDSWNYDDRYLKLTGGWMSGDINFGGDNKIYWGRNTDSASISFKNDGDGDANSYMSFVTSDNGNEYFRWSHSSGSTNTEWMALRGDGLRVRGTKVSLEGHSHNDLYYTKAESNAKYITDITTSVNKLTFTRNGSNIIRDITVNVVHSQGQLTNISNKDNTTKASSGLYIYDSYNQVIGTNFYSSVLSINTGGTIQIAGDWGDDRARNLYWRSQSDRNVANYPWKSWRTILDSENYSSTLDSRYYTESEVNSLLDAKLNRQNLSYGTWNPRGWNLAADYHYNGGDLSISENNGKMYISVDGCFWQNEGQYRVLDTSDIGDIRDSVTLHQYLSATDAAWYPLVWGGNAHHNTSASTGLIYKSYDKLSWQTSSQTLYATNIQTNNIKNLSIGGGIYWNPNVESASDGSDAASITLVRSGVAGGTTLVLSQMNDTNDTIQFKTNTAARLYHNNYPILTTQNTYVSNNKGYINGLEITQVNNADTLDGAHLSDIKNWSDRTASAYWKAGWYKVASAQTATNTEAFLTLDVNAAQSNGHATLFIRKRADSKPYFICTHNNNLNLADFRLYYNGMSMVLYARVPNDWNGRVFRIISEGREGTYDHIWTLYSNVSSTDPNAISAEGGNPYINPTYSGRVDWSNSSDKANYANSAGSVAWNNVTGKPSAFNPAAHTHTVFKNNLMIKGTNGISDSASIHLGIGDSDTGFKWISDGVCQIYANNVAVGQWTSGGMNWFKNPTVNGNKVWNSGNDGSGSGLDSDLVDGLHASRFPIYYNLNMSSTSNNWYKLGTARISESDNIMIHIYSGNGWNSNAFQNAYATLMIKTGYNPNGGLTREFGATMVNHHHSNMTYKLISPSNNTVDIWVKIPWGYSSGWYSIHGEYSSYTHSGASQSAEPTGNAQTGVETLTNAYTSSNVASATKLATPRTIWGQSFDGTADVSGFMKNVKGLIYGDSLDEDWSDGNNTHPWYGIDYRHCVDSTETGKAYTSISSYFGLYFKTGGGRFIFDGGNVGIGTNSPAYKLHVVGDIYTTTGFKKNGSSDSYVLLGGGGHKLESSLNVAYSNLKGITLTGGDSNNEGYRLIFEKTMGGWNINYGVWAIAFRHSGRGTLNIGFDTTNSDGSTYIYNIRFLGSTASRESTPFRAFYNSTTKVFRIYWHYYDYTFGDIAVLRGNMEPHNGTWMASLPNNVGTELAITCNMADQATNADTVDGYHANGLLTALSNSNNGISITVGGTTKSVSNISVNYASSAGNANTLDGYPANGSNVAPYGHIPTIESDGVMEVGKYIDFHNDNNGKHDFSTRLQSTGNYGNEVNLPSASGTLALTSDILNYYWANVKISASSSTTTSPTVSNLTATSSIRMGNILLEYTNEINNSANDSIHLNLRNSGNVSLCVGGGKVGIGTMYPSQELYVLGYTHTKGFGIGIQYLSESELLPTISPGDGYTYRCLEIGRPTKVSCIIADKVPLSGVRGILLKFMQGFEGQIVLLKDLENYGRGNGYFWVMPSGCKIINADTSNILINQNQISNTYDDGRSRFFIYSSKYSAWIEFICSNFY